MQRIVFIFMLSLSYFSQAIASTSQEQATFTSFTNTDLLDKGCEECHRGKRGHRGERGHRGKRGDPGSAGQTAAGQGPTGCLGPQGLSGWPYCLDCPTTPITFTFNTLQDAALTGGAWQVLIMQPDFTIINGPVIDVTLPNQTFSITSTTPALIGTYAIYFKNVGTQNFTQPILNSTSPLTITNPCFSVSNTFVFQAVVNNFPAPTGTSTVLFFETPVCAVT